MVVVGGGNTAMDSCLYCALIVCLIFFRIVQCKEVDSFFLGMLLSLIHISEETLALGASKPKTATSVEKTWEMIKQQEKDGNERVLSGVPNSLPSLIKAYRIQDKARGRTSGSGYQTKHHPSFYRYRKY